MSAREQLTKAGAEALVQDVEQVDLDMAAIVLTAITAHPAFAEWAAESLGGENPYTWPRPAGSPHSDDDPTTAGAWSAGFVAGRAHQDSDVARAALREADDALRQHMTAWITVAPLLEDPYPDDPRWSPWTRYGERACRRGDAARAAVAAALAASPHQDTDEGPDGTAPTFCSTPDCGLRATELVQVGEWRHRPYCADCAAQVRGSVPPEANDE